MARSTVLLSSSMWPSSRNRQRAVQRVSAYRIASATARRESVELDLEPGLHRCDQRQQATAYARACLGGLASDGCLDRMELADASERLCSRGTNAPAGLVDRSETWMWEAPAHLVGAWRPPARDRPQDLRIRTAADRRRAARTADQIGCAEASARSAAAARSLTALRRERWCARPRASAPSAATSSHRLAGQQNRCSCRKCKLTRAPSH